jgi:hypothetical protein
VSHVAVVTRLALRELWISFRLLLVLVAFVGIGSAVALLTAPLGTTLARLAIGLGAATTVAAAVAAMSMAEERIQGRAGWLVVRTVSRGSLMGGWFVAVGSVVVVGTAVAGALGWFAAAGVSVRLDALAFASVVGAIGSGALAAVALGLVAGTRLRARAAVPLTVLACLAIGVVSWASPQAATLLPGGAIATLPTIGEPAAIVARSLRSAGIGLAAAALLLVIGRLLLERADL